MRKKTVHFQKLLRLPGTEGDIGVPACGVTGDVNNFGLTTHKRKVSCERCCRTKMYQASKGKDGR